MGDLTLFVNESANDPALALVESKKSRASAPAIVFTEGDTARRCEIHFLKDNPDETGDPFIYSVAPSSTKFGVGLIDQPPTAGYMGFSDTSGVEGMDEDFDISAEDLQTSIRANLPTNMANATVTGSYTAGYSIDRVDLGAFSTLSVSAAGIAPPNCVVELLQTDPGGATSAKWSLRIVQPPAISQTTFTDVTYASPAVTSVTAGSSGVNAVHRITWPSAAYAGSISISQALPASATVKTIGSHTVANPTVVTSVGHELTTGDQIYVPTNNGSTPTIAGVHTVTVSDVDTFTIPVNVSSAGSGGTFYKVTTQTIGPIPYNVGVSALEDLFEEHTSALAVDGSFTAEKVGGGNYLVYFKGALAGLPIPAGTASSALSTPVAVEGTLNCKTAGVLSLLAGQSEYTSAKLEIEKTVSAVPTTVAFRPSVTIRAELIST